MGNCRVLSEEIGENGIFINISGILYRHVYENNVGLSGVMVFYPLITILSLMSRQSVMGFKGNCSTQKKTTDLWYQQTFSHLDWFK